MKRFLLLLTLILTTLGTAAHAQNVNKVVMVPSASGVAPSLNATGSDSNISLNLVAKGTGTVKINGSTVTGGTQTVANGGTGAVTETAHGLLIGEGTSPFAATAACATNTAVIGQGGSADPICSTSTLPTSGAIPSFITATASETPGSITQNTCVDQSSTITVTGAATGDACIAGVPAAGAGTHIQASCYISAADIAKIRLCNVNTGAQTGTTGTYRATVVH